MTLPDLNESTLWAILNNQIDDATVNALALHSLGFRWDPASQTWDSTQADPGWRSDRIPDFIAHRPDIVQLTRSIPAEDKQLLKTYLHFEGYQIHELTPQKTRRATVVNWLLSHMKHHERLNSTETYVPPPNRS